MYFARNAKFYLPAGTAAAVAEQYLTPLHTGDSSSVQILEDQFLLTVLYPGYGNDDSMQRVDAFMSAWARVDGNADWDTAWLLLLRRLAKHQPASNAFGPHLPQLFNRIHAMLKVTGQSSERKNILPAFQYLNAKRSQTIAGKLVVDLLGVETAMDRLEALLASVRTQLHPSNTGQQSERIIVFITAMAEAFATMLGRDKTALVKPLKQRFLRAVLPLLEPSLLGKSLVVVNLAQAAIRHLAWVAPMTVCGQLLRDVVETGLDPDNLTRSHQAPAAMKALTVMIQPMVLSGRRTRRVLHDKLPGLLMQSLPGIDPNDQRKTAVTMMLSYLVLSCIPIDDAHSPAVDSHLDYGVDDDDDVASAHNEDVAPDLSQWAQALVARLLVLAQSRGKRAKKGMSAQLDGLMDFFYESTCRLAFLQMSARVMDAGPVRSVTAFVLDECLPNAHTEALALCRALANNSPQCLRDLVPPLAQLVRADTHKDRATWALVCLGGLARLSGAFLLNFLADLDGAVERGLKHDDLVVRKMSAKLLRRTARCLLDTYQVKPDAPIVRYGAEAVWADAQPKWHVCSPAEEHAAYTLVTAHWARALAGVKADKERRHTHCIVLFQAVRALLSHIRPATGLATPKHKHGAVQWPTQEALFADVDAVAALAHADTRALKVCCKMMGLLGEGAQGPKGCGRGERVKGFAMWSSWLGDLSNSRAREAEERARALQRYARGESESGEVEDRRDVVEMAHVVLAHIEHRLHVRTYEASFWAARQVREQAGAAFYDHAGEELYRLSVHGFSDVRKMAQAQLKHVHMRASWVAHNHLPRTLASLCTPGVASEEWTGSVYLLGSDKTLALIGRKWARWAPAVRALVLQAPAVVRTLPAHRQAKAQDRLQRVVQRVLADWQRFPADPGVPAEERAQLVRDIVGVGSATHWRLKLTGLAALGVLVDGPAPREAWVHCVECAQSEVLPLATVALAVLRRLFAFPASGAPADLLGSRELWTCAAKVLAEDRNIAGAGEDDRAEWSSGVGELLKFAKSLSGRPDFPRSRIEAFSLKEFHCTKAALWANMAAACTDKALALDTLRFLASPEAESAKDRLLRRTAAAELFAGVVRAKPEWAADALPTVTRLLNELPNGGLWGDAFRFAAQGPGKAGAVLAEYCERELGRVLSGIGADGEPMADNEGFMFASNLLRVSVATMLEERSLSARILPRVLRCFTHQYKAVREIAGVVAAMSVVVGTADKAHVVAAALQAASASANGLESCFHLLLPLCLQGDALVYMDVLVPLVVPVVIKAQGHADVELAQLAKHGLSLIANVVRCSSSAALALQFETVLADEAARAKDWHKRRAVAALLGPFHYNHTCLLFRQGAGALVQKTAELLLKDAQAEVRDQAKSLLAGLFAASVPNEAVFAPARDRYVKLARTPGDAAKRRTGVLALAALVLAFPYEVPAFLPLAVVELAKAVALSNDSTAKQALSEFRRTHQDDWAEHRLKFDSEQLESVDNTLASPEYYA